MWQFRDSEGETWLSKGSRINTFDTLDWEGKISINFDGWHFVKISLPPPVHPSLKVTDSLINQWTAVGGNKRVEFPIKLTGFVVEWKQYIPYVNALRHVTDHKKPVTISLKDLFAEY